MNDHIDAPTKGAMKPRKGRKYRTETRYIHNRSEGLTRRRNGGSQYQTGR